MDDQKFYTELVASKANEEKKRLFYVIIFQLLIIAMLSGWCIFRETQYETHTITIEAEQETSGSGSNYVVGGDYGEAKSQDY